jgi:hypothetical protein
MAALTPGAVSLLEAAGCDEVDDDVVSFPCGTQILLSRLAVADLNRQARETNNGAPHE